MKQLFILIIVLFWLTATVVAQVSINSDNSQPNPAAMLDVKSSTKGFLPPRMTHAEIDAITNPVNGLIVYCTDCGTDGSGAFFGYINGIWAALSVCAPPTRPGSGVPQADNDQIVWNWNSVVGASGYKWNTSDNYSTAEDLGVQLTKTESGLTCNTSYTRYVWAYNSCGSSSSHSLMASTTNTLVSAPVAGIHTATDVQITWNWNPVNGATGYKWNTVNSYATAIDLGLNTSKIETGLTCNTVYTRYVWSYGACGNSITTILSKSTTGSQNVLSVSIASSVNPVCAGTLVTFSSTVVNGGSSPTYNWYVNNVMQNEHGPALIMAPDSFLDIFLEVFASPGCVSGSPAVSNTINQAVNVIPVSPVAGVMVPGATQVQWNWNPVSGATGYKWNTTNNYLTALNLGTSTTYMETGLTCNTPYLRYIWAYNTCGQSAVTVLNQSTSVCPFVCGQNLVISHIAGAVAPVSKTTSYGTVTGIPGETAKCWITSNLGSDHQATAVNDATEASAGWYWQFNCKQGYMHDGLSVAPSWTITSISENNNWQTTNDPCKIELGMLWRIPTYSEWYNVDNIGGWANWIGTWNSGLKLHAAGLISTDSSLDGRGIFGYSWSSTQFNPTLGWNLGFSSSVSAMYNAIKVDGISIRCLKE